MPALRLAAVPLALLLASLAGCGNAPSTSSGGDPLADAAAALRSASPTRAAEASRTLRERAATEPDAVRAAVLAELRRASPTSDATVVSLRLDADAATRLGLPPADPADAIASVLPALRKRALARGLEIGTVRSGADGAVDLVLVGGRTHAEAEREAEELARAGWLRFVAVARPPRTDEEGAERRAWLAAETRALEDAARARRPYAPTRADRFVAPEGGPAPNEIVVDGGAARAGAPVDVRVARLAALETPKDATADWTDLDVVGASRVVGAGGGARIRLVVAAGRRADLLAWTKSLVGRDVAVLRDGVVVETIRVESPWSTAIEILPAGDPAADEILLGTGRLPRPLRVDERAGERDPTAPDLVRALADVGPVLVPALEALARDDAPPRERRVAAQALAKIRARASATVTSSTPPGDDASGPPPFPDDEPAPAPQPAPGRAPPR